MIKINNYKGSTLQPTTWNTLDQNEFIQDMNEGLSTKELQEKYQVSDRTIRKWKRKIRDIFKLDEHKEKVEQKYNILDNDKKHIHLLKQEITSLKRSLDLAKKHISKTDNIKSIISDVLKEGFGNTLVPEFEWYSKSNNKDNIVPVLCISDTHIGSVVDPENINYMNEYNIEIAKKRIIGITDDFIDTYKNKMNYQYDGVVLILGGDIIENAMHGAEETNDVTVIDQVLIAFDILKEVIKQLKEAFGKVAIFAVSGNHGRLIADKYVKLDHRYANSLEKILYHFLEYEFKNENNVQIHTSPSDILYFSINGLKFRLEHGDQITWTGNAIAGPFTSLERARLKKSAIDSAVGNSFDLLIIGHFHQHLVHDGKMIVMDSLVGYNSYAQSKALPYSLPGCTTFSINSSGNLIFATNLVWRENVIKINNKKKIEIF